MSGGGDVWLLLLLRLLLLLLVVVVTVVAGTLAPRHAVNLSAGHTIHHPQYHPSTPTSLTLPALSNLQATSLAIRPVQSTPLHSTPPPPQLTNAATPYGPKRPAAEALATMPAGYVRRRNGSKGYGRTAVHQVACVCMYVWMDGVAGCLFVCTCRQWVVLV
ncbi:hypothetical protein IWX46DRAFT_138855 [Phyllosticta citricarpa]|uniref:Uncharacterized protein n=1 Tax=Phyllosticta citricarpa TaxID=55181 RepID=A0ABR1MPY3_9PEZI